MPFNSCWNPECRVGSWVRTDKNGNPKVVDIYGRDLSATPWSEPNSGKRTYPLNEFLQVSNKGGYRKLRIQVIHVATWLASDKESPLLKALLLTFGQTIVRAVDVVCGDGNAATYSLYKSVKRSDDFKGEYKNPWIMYALNHFIMMLNQNRPLADRVATNYVTSTTAEHCHRPKDGTLAHREGILEDTEPYTDSMFLCLISYKKRLSNTRQINASANALINKYSDQISDPDGKDLDWQIAPEIHNCRPVEAAKFPELRSLCLKDYDESSHHWTRRPGGKLVGRSHGDHHSPLLVNISLKDPYATDASDGPVTNTGHRYRSERGKKRHHARWTEIQERSKSVGATTSSRNKWNSQSSYRNQSHQRSSNNESYSSWNQFSRRNNDSAEEYKQSWKSTIVLQTRKTTRRKYSNINIKSTPRMEKNTTTR